MCNSLQSLSIEIYGSLTSWNFIHTLILFLYQHPTQPYTSNPYTLYKKTFSVQFKYLKQQSVILFTWLIFISHRHLSLEQTKQNKTKQKIKTKTKSSKQTTRIISSTNSIDFHLHSFMYLMYQFITHINFFKNKHYNANS